jgi:hypothetical protein
MLFRLGSGIFGAGGPTVEPLAEVAAHEHPFPKAHALARGEH